MSTHAQSPPPRWSAFRHLSTQDICETFTRNAGVLDLDGGVSVASGPIAQLSVCNISSDEDKGVNIASSPV